MKVSAFTLATCLILMSGMNSTANAYDRCAGYAGMDSSRTGTVFDIAQQYSKGGRFGGITSGTTGTALDVARLSMDFFGAPELFASAWRVPPILGKGD